MPLTPEKRALALTATREAAAAFVGDMAHIREVLGRDKPLPREIRHLSAILRRLLVDGSGDLRAIAPPRIGGIELSAPDNSIFYGKFSFHPLTLFLSGVPRLLGASFRALTSGGPSKLKPSTFDENRTVNLSLDGFLNQRVLLFQHQWVSRRAVIRYVANIMSGVHSGSPKDAVDLALEWARRTIKFTPTGETSFKMEFDPNPVFWPSLPSQLAWSQTAIDLVLIELWAVAYYLTLSPDIVRLEQEINAELANA